MLRINVTIDISRALERLDAARDQVPFATALALTKTAQDVKASLQDAMGTSFENVTGFTRNSLSVTRATKAELTAWIGVRGGADGAAKWLAPEIYGGHRQLGLEVFLEKVGLPPPGMWAVPGKFAKLTGNKRIDVNWLAALIGAITVQGQTGLTVRQGKGKNARKGGASQYFVLREKVGRLEPGIYGKRGTNIYPYIVFVRQPTYRKRYDFFGIAQRRAMEMFPKRFDEAIKTALATRR